MVFPERPIVKRRPKIPPVRSKIPNENAKMFPSKFTPVVKDSLSHTLEARCCAREIKSPSAAASRLEWPSLKSSVAVETNGKSAVAVTKYKSKVTVQIKRKIRYFPTNGEERQKKQSLFRFSTAHIGNDSTAESLARAFE